MQSFWLRGMAYEEYVKLTEEIPEAINCVFRKGGKIYDWQIGVIGSLEFVKELYFDKYQIFDVNSNMYVQ